MESVDLMKILGGVFEGFTTGGLIFTCLKTLLFCGSGIMLWMVGRWIERIKEEVAFAKTQEGRTKDQSEVAEENKKISDDAQKSESEVRDIFKNDKTTGT